MVLLQCDLQKIVLSFSSSLLEGCAAINFVRTLPVYAIFAVGASLGYSTNGIRKVVFLLLNPISD